MELMRKPNAAKWVEKFFLQITKGRKTKPTCLLEHSGEAVLTPLGEAGGTRQHFPRLLAF